MDQTSNNNYNNNNSNNDNDNMLRVNLHSFENLYSLMLIYQIS